MADIADLFAEAGRKLRSDFEYIRSTNPHAGEKGEEIEQVLKDFLNAHLPRRFAAGSGIMIDFNGNVSRQTDVIVYDALTSPVYRASEKTQILPVHTAAAVIEVKASLDGRSLRDSYEKIASCKRLKKPPPSNMDRRATEGDLLVTGTMGVVFAFASPLTLDKIAEHAEALNEEFDSDEWPDIILVLDKGLFTYSVQWPGEQTLGAGLGTRPPRGEAKVYPPPWYVHMILHSDGELALNRLFLLLLTQLAFFPYRHHIPPYKAMLRAEVTQAMTIRGYQFTADEKLVAAGPDLYNENNPTVPLEILIRSSEGTLLCQLQYFEWPGGGVVRSAGIPLQGLLPLLLPDPKILVMPLREGVQISNILPLDAEMFCSWVEVIKQRTNMIAELRDMRK